MAYSLYASNAGLVAHYALWTTPRWTTKPFRFSFMDFISFMTVPLGLWTNLYNSSEYWVLVEIFSKSSIDSTWKWTAASVGKQLNIFSCFCRCTGTYCHGHLHISVSMATKNMDPSLPPLCPEEYNPRCFVSSLLTEQDVFNTGPWCFLRNIQAHTLYTEGNDCAMRSFFFIPSHRA